MNTVNIAPTPVGYKRILEFIIANYPDAGHRKWAKDELIRVQPNGVLVTEWSKE